MAVYIKSNFYKSVFLPQKYFKSLQTSMNTLCFPKQRLKRFSRDFVRKPLDKTPQGARASLLYGAPPPPPPPQDMIQSLL